MSKLKIGVVVFIVLLGLALRLNNYAQYPQRGASSDEYSYTFLGHSLLTKGMPISWSAFTAYKNREDLTIRKLYFPIVWPYFDHPPLTGFLTGGFALLRGENTFPKITLETIRLVPIFLSIFSMGLVFLIAQKIYGYKTGIWALLIYATTTTFIMNSRVVFAENLLTPLFLGAIYLYMFFKKKPTFKKALLLGLLAGLSFWTKEVGIIVFVTLVYFLIQDRIKLKYVATFALFSIMIILGYFAYGIYYDKEVFFAIWGFQSNRQIGPKTILYLMSTPIIVNKFYYDGWYYFGLISFFAAFLNFKKHMMVLVPSVLYFLLLNFSLTQGGEMGWYMLPLFPFMAILTGALLVEHIKKNSWFVFIMLLFVGFYNVRYLYEENFGLVATQFRVMMLLMFVPFIILKLMGKENAFAKLYQFWFYLFIFTNVILSFNYIHPA